MRIQFYIINISILSFFFGTLMTMKFTPRILYKLPKFLITRPILGTYKYSLLIVRYCLNIIFFTGCLIVTCFKS